MTVETISIVFGKRIFYDVSRVFAETGVLHIVYPIKGTVYDADLELSERRSWRVDQ